MGAPSSPPVPFSEGCACHQPLKFAKSACRQTSVMLIGQHPGGSAPFSLCSSSLPPTPFPVQTGPLRGSPCVCVHVCACACARVCVHLPGKECVDLIRFSEETSPSSGPAFLLPSPPGSQAMTLRVCRAQQVLAGGS